MNNKHIKHKNPSLRGESQDSPKQSTGFANEVKQPSKSSESKQTGKSMSQKRIDILSKDGAYFKNAIALTGGIATGKSTACSILKLHGYPIIDTDLIAHEVLEQSADEVVRIFGDEILDSRESALDSSHKSIESSIDSSDLRESKTQIERKKTQINRKKLGAIVFSDKAKLRALESILHPKIRAVVKQKAQIFEAQNITYFIDIPLFYELQERGSGYAIPLTLLIYAPRDLQLARIQKRDNLSYESAKTRLSNQIDIKKKREKADFVIENTGNIRGLQDKIEAFLRQI